MIRGESFQSVPDTGILSMSFPLSGDHVIVVIGDRNDAVARPVYNWFIDSSGKLVLTEDGITQATLGLISFDDDFIEVWDDFRGGVKYRRTANRGANKSAMDKPDLVSS